MRKSQFTATLVLMMTSGLLMSQVVWKGGTPGRAHDWNISSNWSNNRVPTDFDDVVIPDLSTQGCFYPIIKTEIEPIQFLFIASGAELEVTDTGILTIDGSGTFNDGILNMGHLKVFGDIFTFGVAGSKIINDGSGKVTDARAPVMAAAF